MNMFIELLEKYDYMVLLLKPKRQDEIDLYLNKFSKFKDSIIDGELIYIEKYKKKVFICLQNRFNPTIQLLKKDIKSLFIIFLLSLIN